MPGGPGGLPHGLVKKDGFPEGCTQEKADQIYDYFKAMYDACLDQTCRDSIQDQYDQAWSTCTVPNNG